MEICIIYDTMAQSSYIMIMQNENSRQVISTCNFEREFGSRFISLVPEF